MPIPEDIILKYGSHASREQGMCVMEAVAYVAGEPHSDRPKCVCPVIATLLRSWNDALPDDETRTRLLMPLIPVVIGTRADKATEERRSYMALDWLIRVNLPAFLELTPALQPHAAIIRAMPVITGMASALDAGPNVRAASDAVWATASVAARAASVAASAAASAAASVAASAAAWDSACDAARDAACDAASDAASDAVCDAACDAACATTWAAARAAADEVLAPTVQELQASAQELVRRMSAVSSGLQP